MYFQTLDSKGECLGYYANQQLWYEDLPLAADKTWYYSSSLKDRHVEYARIYAGGATLQEACPPELQPTWDKIANKLKSFLKSFQAAKINLNETCIYNLIPEFFLYELCDTKDKITQHVLTHTARPLNHDFMVDVIKMLEDIKVQPLHINTEPIRTKLVTVRGKNFIKRLQDVTRACDYNPYGTVTGRLTTHPNTFPILTLHRDFRGCLRPQNDWFLELDYNAAEVRTLLGLSGTPQPAQDIHEWNIENIYDNAVTRREAKQKIFEWLYSHREDPKAEIHYNKSFVKEKYWDGTNVSTEFGRIIKGVDKHHALNYIIQSTTSDLVLSKAVEIHERLQKMESRIAFMLHDSIVIDLNHEERHVIPELMDLFGTTRWGQYKVNVALGKNFGDMKELNINGA